MMPLSLAFFVLFFCFFFFVCFCLPSDVAPNSSRSAPTLDPELTDSKGLAVSLISPNRPDAAPSTTTGCAVEAYGAVKVSVEDVAALRKAPGPLGGRTIPPSLLKHADHQTVLGLAALLRAVDDFGWHGRSFEDWGLIAAPRFLGRILVAAAMDRFKNRGVSGMSPLIIPTLSLHAVAGSLSLALKTHGFNYGVGGGHGHLVEALLTGLAARDENNVPGVWIVATQFSPEPIPDLSGHSTNASFGYAVALALTSEEAAARSRLNLRVVPTSARETGTGDDDRDVAGNDPPSGLVALSSFLDRSASSLRPRHWYCPLPGGGALALDDDPARASKPVAARRGVKAG